MKALFNSVLFIGLTLTAVNSFAQQEITVTANAANTVASRVLINDPGLTNNPNAIILATPIGNTATLNPHLIGAWYYNNKWWIFNTDHATMPIGSSFKVQVFLTPDANHFLYVIPQTDAGQNYTCIDNPALNNNPTAQFKIFQNHAPDNRPYAINPNEAEARYDSPNGKWCLVNVNLSFFQAKTAYNIVVASGLGGSITPIGIPFGKPTTTTTTTKSTIPDTPKALPIGPAGGDLSGTYPNPTVQKLLGRPLSTVAPTVGQLLRWNGTEWEPVTISSNPVEPLKFNPTLGKKIILYPGQTGDVGLTVQGNLLQMHSDNPSADVAIGYDQAGTFNEKFRVKANGAIAVSGDSGQNGQVLTSNGAGSPPTWKQPPAATMQTFFKTQQIPGAQYPIGALTDLSLPFNYTGLSHSIVLTKRSRLVISATIRVAGPQCSLGCTDGQGYFYVEINNIFQDLTRTQTIVPHDYIGLRFSVVNYMIDMDPGTYNIEFKLGHQLSQNLIFPGTGYSSIMVIPL